MTGVERYAYNICKAMARLQQPFTIVCPKATIHQDYDVSDLEIVHYGIGSSHFWEQCILPFFFLNKKEHLVLSFTGLGAILIRHKIMTIHDLAFLKNPSWYSRTYYWYYRLMTPLAVKTSQYILTVSEFSKNEILRSYPFLKEEKIHVVYNAINRQLFQHTPNLPASAERFALAVSSIDPRKNFHRLIQAFNNISNIKLYIVGQYNPVFQRQDGLTKGTDNINFLGRVSDEKLVSLYNQADFFIFPSLYEGFGLPPLEAMACGCPVLVSDIPVEKEVCGDAALYFNPLDSNDIHDTILQHLKGNDLSRKAMQERGFQNIKRFSWEKSAIIVLQLINEYHNFSNKTHNKKS
jgi:glycosyltransferase involved in cell wall biosynthesis